MPTHVIAVNGESADANTGDVQVPIFQRKTTLTDAQIKALQTTYIELVPAPGAGKAIVFHRALLNWDLQGGTYTNVNADNAIMISYGDWSKEVSSLTTVPALAQNYTYLMTLLTIPEDRPTWSGYVRDFTDGSFSNFIDNTPLKLIASNGADGDFTGGNVANSLEVTIFYSIVDI